MMFLAPFNESQSEAEVPNALVSMGNIKGIILLLPYLYRIKTWSAC